MKKFQKSFNQFRSITVSLLIALSFFSSYAQSTEYSPSVFPIVHSSDLGEVDDLIRIVKNRFPDWAICESPTEISAGFFPVDIFANDPERCRSEIVFVINKNDEVAGSQNLQMYYRGHLIMRQLVSTGSETFGQRANGSRTFRTTDAGFHRINKSYFKRIHKSKAYDVDLDYFMGIKAFDDSMWNGIAMHATSPSYYHRLGGRASGGCIRLHRNVSRFFFEFIKSLDKQDIPSVNRNGSFASNQNQELIYENNWDVLVVIRDGVFE